MVIIARDPFNQNDKLLTTALTNRYSSLLGYNQYAFILGFMVPCTWYLLHSYIVPSGGKEADRQ